MLVDYALSPSASTPDITSSAALIGRARRPGCGCATTPRCAPMADGYGIGSNVCFSSARPCASPTASSARRSATRSPLGQFGLVHASRRQGHHHQRGGVGLDGAWSDPMQSLRPRRPGARPRKRLPGSDSTPATLPSRAGSDTCPGRHRRSQDPERPDQRRRSQASIAAVLICSVQYPRFPIAAVPLACVRRPLRRMVNASVAPTSAVVGSVEAY